MTYERHVIYLRRSNGAIELLNEIFTPEEIHDQLARVRDSYKGVSAESVKILITIPDGAKELF